jgi:hypothetical protein
MFTVPPGSSAALTTPVADLGAAFLLQKEPSMPHPYPTPRLTPLFELSATLERFDDLGKTPLGHRMMAVVGQGGGTINGTRVRGQLLHGSGGDWLIVRPDGAGQLDVRITIKTDDDALIYMRYEGICAGDAVPRVLGGEAVPPGDYYFRTTPYFETSSQKYAWLNTIVAVGVGQVDLSKAWVGYAVYEVG